MFKFKTNDKDVVAIASADVPRIIDGFKANGRFYAIEAQRVDGSGAYRMICGRIPRKVADTFVCGRATSPSCVAVYSLDRKAVRTPRLDSIRVIAGDGKLYVVTR